MAMNDMRLNEESYAGREQVYMQLVANRCLHSLHSMVSYSHIN